MKQFRVPIELQPNLLGQSVEMRFPTELKRVGDLSEAASDTVCFLENPKFLDAALEIPAGLLIVGTQFRGHDFPRANLLWTEHPYMTFVMLVRYWLKLEEQSIPAGISPNAIVHATAVLGADVRISDYVVIGENCRLGDRVVVDAHCVVMENSRIGDDSRLYPRVTLYPDTIVGARCILHSGVVIGADGFGFVPYQGRQEKIPQLGNVEIGDDVEIGANSAIDRSTFQTTRVGNGTKLDNLVQVGHNCVIGESSILCAQVGLAGGTTIGDRVYLGGQSGTAGHHVIGDDSLIGAQSGVLGDLEPGSRVLGSPASDAGLQKRIIIAGRMLPDLLPSLKKIIKKGE
jgi:UDP-3-O-[3-hydroxymyristoyl] glucosamine N-acyltransferase